MYVNFTEKRWFLTGTLATPTPFGVIASLRSRRGNLPSNLKGQGCFLRLSHQRHGHLPAMTRSLTLAKFLKGVKKPNEKKSIKPARSAVLDHWPAASCGTSACPRSVGGGNCHRNEWHGLCHYPDCGTGRCRFLHQEQVCQTDRWCRQRI